MTRAEEPPQGRRGSLAPHALYETEAAELTDLSVDCSFNCVETTSQRLWSAKNDSEYGPSAAPDTVLYLAYGSNMCAQTFLGMRKIKPLSQMNVYVPSLRLTFSLPGVAYMEPCFANVDYRDADAERPDGSPSKHWDGCLVGVVYEVTKSDWRNIMRTEGGGASYQEIVVPCVPLPSSATGGATLPGTFMARTLHAPRTPDHKRPGNCGWWDRLTTGPYRPRDDYAQPSQRYVNLLRTGAQEHGLPRVYKDYLDSIQPYTPTHTGQKIGKFVFLVCFGPLFLFMLRVAALFADETGQTPKLLSGLMTAMSNMMWITYDYVLKPVFGDGERTDATDYAKGESTKTVGEKKPLLDG